MALTVVSIRNAVSKEKPYKIFDGRGLYLLVNPTGSKLWRFKYTLAKREKLISFGPFPEVSLSQARNLRAHARSQLIAGIDPSAARKAQQEAKVSNGATFELVAREWLAKFSPTWAPSHASKVIRRLERDIYPWLGNRPINEIGARELLTALQRIERRGAVETAHRAKQNCSQVFRYAIATGRAERDPSADLKGALPPPKTKHHASITDPKKIGALLRAIDGYEGSQVTRLALQLAPLVFVRPGELRAAEWAEFKLDASEWRISATRMKMRSEHVVPLSTQARRILDELKRHTGSGTYVFPGVRSRGRCMSENTLNAALRRLGYTSSDMTTHGFRSMASTCLNEMGWNRDAIERQLAHSDRDSIRAAYNYAEHLPLRREMMQAWADYLDRLRKGGHVIRICG